MAKLGHIVHTEDVVNVEKEIRYIAMESGFTENMIGSFRRVIPAIADQIKGSLTSLFTAKEEISEEAKLINEIDKTNREIRPLIKNLTFTTYDRLLVDIPEGFDANYITGCKTLSEINNELLSSANKVLRDYNALLASFITNKDVKISLADHTDFYTEMEKKRKKNLDQMRTVFPENNTRSKCYLPAVISRFQDVDQVVKECGYLAKTNNLVNMNAVYQLVTESVSLLDMIIDNVQKDGVDKISGAATRNIAEGAYVIAKYVELLGILKFRNIEVIKSIHTFVNQLKKISND